MGYLDFQAKISLLWTETDFCFYEILKNTVCFKVETMVFFSSDILYLELLTCISNRTSSPVLESAGSFKSIVVPLHEM